MTAYFSIQIQQINQIKSQHSSLLFSALFIRHFAQSNGSKTNHNTETYATSRNRRSSSMPQFVDYHMQSPLSPNLASHIRHSGPIPRILCMHDFSKIWLQIHWHKVGPLRHLHAVRLMNKALISPQRALFGSW